MALTKEQWDLLDSLVGLNCDEPYKTAIAAALAEIDALRAEYEKLGEWLNAVRAENWQLAEERDTLRAEVEQVRALLEQGRIACEPFDDLKPRKWLTDYENVAQFHSAVRAYMKSIGDAWPFAKRTKLEGGG